MDDKKPFVCPDRFDVEKNFKFYLTLVRIDERKVLPFQLREMRKAFYGAWGIKLISDRDSLTANDMSEDEAVQILEHQLKQVGEYWNKEIAKDVFNPN